MYQKAFCSFLLIFVCLMLCIIFSRATVRLSEALITSSWVFSSILGFKEFFFTLPSPSWFLDDFRCWVRSYYTVGVIFGMLSTSASLATWFLDCIIKKIIRNIKHNNLSKTEHFLPFVPRKNVNLKRGWNFWCTTFTIKEVTSSYEK